jgi:hypothetical protein
MFLIAGARFQCPVAQGVEWLTDGVHKVNACTLEGSQELLAHHGQSADRLLLVDGPVDGVKDFEETKEDATYFIGVGAIPLGQLRREVDPLEEPK